MVSSTGGGFRERRRCSRDTYPEPHIIDYALVDEEKAPNVSNLSRLQPGYPAKGRDLVSRTVLTETGRNDEEGPLWRAKNKSELIHYLLMDWFGLIQAGPGAAVAWAE